MTERQRAKQTAIRRVSTGEGSPSRSPANEGRRVGHGEPPARLRDEDDEQMAQKIRRNLGLQPAADDEAEGAVAIDSQRSRGLTNTQREGNPMTFSEAKRSVDLAIRRGQLPDFQREGALHVARTNARAFRQLLACTPIDVDERTFKSTLFKPRHESTPTNRQIFANLGLVEAGWNPKSTW